MKKHIYLYGMLLLSGVLSASCDDFLDVTPDNRTEIDSKDKITQILVSAYSRSLPLLVHEQMSDNVVDRGASYDWSDDNCKDAYLFHEHFTNMSQDSPAAIWENNYKAIAAANKALEAIERLGNGAELSAQKGEALLCRAYAHYTLCNTFCQAYNTQTSETDLGIPYVYDVEETAIKHYERGTVAGVYKQIEADLEAGLPLIDDNLYTTPKYHFNKAAACAFAAEFFLYYGKYQRAVECATAAIGAQPLPKMRTWELWDSFTDVDEFTNAWVDSSQPANLFLQGLSSVAGRMYYSSRGVVTNVIQNETGMSFGPWGNTHLVYGSYWWANNLGAVKSNFWPKTGEYFVFSDEVQQIGQPYIMNVRFSVERTAIDRAEAYALLGDYDKAAADLSDFYIASQGTASRLSAETIAAFYDTADEAYKKEIAPRFTVNPGMQENMVHACLHARRILTLHEGTRLGDIKRYGISYVHDLEGGSSVTVEPFDIRLALQIPNLVIEAGMEPNPR